MSPYQTNTQQKIRLFQISALMSHEGLSNNFISNAVEIGLEHEGMYELFELWFNERDPEERQNIIDGIQSEIDDYRG